MIEHLSYVECDLPDGMTLRQWRRSRAEAPARRRPLRRVRLALGAATAWSPSHDLAA